MKFKKPVNDNYCANIVQIKNIIDLVGCDNIKHTNIFGNLAIVDKLVQIGDIGVFFPPETELSQEFLSNNNLYSHSNLNVDLTKKGYISENGRIRTIKLRGNISMGLFLPLTCFNYLNLNAGEFQIGDTFDIIEKNQICKKYMVYRQSGNGTNCSGKGRKPKISKIVDNQFRFHIDTSQLGKNIHKVNPFDLISITSKWHGTSGVSAKILCNRKLSIIEKLLLKLGVKIQTQQYENIYSSRSVIKNDDINSNPEHFYKVDIWGLANDRLKEYIENGMTLYYEIVGYLPSGSYIQSGYDYECNENQFKIVIYRITHTNHDGKVYEFSAKQVQDWCMENGLDAVRELFYGRAIELFNMLSGKNRKENNFENNFLDLLDLVYNNNYSSFCNNGVPEEGIVLRIEKNYIESYKLKSKAFLQHETKELDKCEENIEDNS